MKTSRGYISDEKIGKKRRGKRGVVKGEIQWNGKLISGETSGSDSGFIE
jgi:hypothetical protein